MSELNIFEYAAKNKLRFATERGLLTAEDLFDIKLSNQAGPSLDKIAISLDEELSKTEKSFVKKVTPQNKELQIKLDIVKHVISVKQDQEEAKVAAAARATQRRILQEAIAKKKLEAIDNADLASLEAELAKIDAA
jgi:hypothetical protein